MTFKLIIKNRIKNYEFLSIVVHAFGIMHFTEMNDIQSANK